MAFLLAVAVVRFSLTLHLPLDLLDWASHDDGLFIRNAASLASGHWLGDFDELTLAKGPGYPLLLAINAWSGLPLSASHAILQILAIAISTWAVFQLTRSYRFSAVAFLILIFNPVGFLPELQRVFRDQIYWAQALIVFSLFSVLFLAPPRNRWLDVGLSLLAGAFLAWAWLTREEGIWFLPGLLVLAAGALLSNRNNTSGWLATATRTGLAGAAFLSLNLLFMLGNLFAYGSFVGVDFKESNFKAALDALQSVEVGPIEPYLPVPAAARVEIAKHSPTFEPLGVLLAPGGPLSGWGNSGCNLYRSTCGDIGGGWFVWAFREAAARQGYYKSPRIAAENFGRITDEVAMACEEGKLRCRRSWLQYMPVLPDEQWASFPDSAMAISGKIAFLLPPSTAAVRPPPKSATERFSSYWAFLNFPLVNSASEDGSTIVRGWYRDTESQEWPVFQIHNEAGATTPSSLKRNRSPDVAKHFSDDRAGFNRFEITSRCTGDCTIVAATSAGTELSLVLDRDRRLSATYGTATLYVDSVSRELVVEANNSTREFALQVRTTLIHLYELIIPTLMIVGLAAFIAACARAIWIRTLAPVLIVAFGAWILVATRVVLLALIDISSFPATNFSYSAPAIYLAALASILSVAALLSAVGRTRPDTNMR